MPLLGWGATAITAMRYDDREMKTLNKSANQVLT